MANANDFLSFLTNNAIKLNQLFFKYGIYYPVVFFRGERVPGCLRNLMKSQFEAYGQLKKMQLKKLNVLLAYAKSNVPYYRDTLPGVGLESLSGLQSIPFIDKETLRNNQKKLTADIMESGATHKTTGGSTGAPITVVKTKASMAQELAAVWRGYSWAGVEIGDKQGRFWGVPHGSTAKMRAKLIDFVCHRFRCSAFAFSEQDLEKYYFQLKRFQPQYFYGYVSMLTQFGHFIQEKHQKVPFDLKCIITTSEVLSNNDRELLEQVFRCKVYNEYGCGEIGTIAQECDYGNLHINDENIIVEIVGEDGKLVPPGQMGEIVVTELNNFSMPLIRYRMADYGMLSSEICDCGRGLGILKDVFGREYDFLINAKGERFHGEFFLYIIEDIKKMGGGVKGVQFVQETVNKLTVNIVPRVNFDGRYNEMIVDRIHHGFDSGVQVDIVEVDQIQREESGKLRVVKRLFS